ncbi:MAG: CRTAC1 family protein, partial [Thermoanaerobaculales bacterium]
VAVNMDGAPEASMGVDVGDFDADGDPDIFLTHLNRQTNTIYINDGTGFFNDGTSVTGLGSTSFRFTAFGTAWIDYDNDTWLDLLIANGAVQIIEELALKRDPFPLHQKNQLFKNLGNGRFKDVSAASGAAFELSEVSRGAAFGDIDNDGDLDVIITNNNGPVRLLRNEVGNSNHWIGLRVLDPEIGRDALGARVAVHVKGSKPLWRRVRADGSYGCANDPRILIGLGDADRVEAVEVVWPDGIRERWVGLETGRYTTLKKGKGSQPTAPIGAQPRQ